MGFLSFLKRQHDLPPTKQDKVSAHIEWKEAMNVEPLREQAKADDDALPYGWIYQNRRTLESIQREHAYFLRKWLGARDASPLELYPALKSFVRYMKDTRELCRSKGKYFEIWYEETVLGVGYYDERKAELEDLEANLDKRQEEYEEKEIEATDFNDKLEEMRPVVIQKLIENDGILQSDFWKLFDEDDLPPVKDILYLLRKEGSIKRIKSGRSFIIHYVP